MKNKKMFGIIEAIFDIVYLLIICMLGLYYLLISSYEYATLLSLIAFVLGFGDSFHLIPRILSIMRNDTEKYYRSLGIGKMITSISMTIVYVLLWEVILKYIDISGIWTTMIYGLAILRIIMCLLPCNHWIDNQGSETWNLIRNIPFILIGIQVIIGFYLMRNIYFSYMWIFIILSFVFYIPVVLYSKKNPKIGMLMLPKSCMYIFIVAMAVL